MRMLLIPLGLALLGSCKSKSPTPPGNNDNPAEAMPNTAPSETKPNLESPTPMTHDTPPVDPAAMAATASGLNSFSLALYKTTKKEGNTLLSPFSVAAALSLVELGARGETATALHKALGAESAEVHRRGLQGLVQTISGDGEPVDRYGEMIHPHSLRIANSLWPAEGYSVNESFVADARSIYKALAQTIDVSDPKGSADRINAWVLDATNGKIKDLVGPGNITALTRMILVNAVHFLGRWQEPFSESNTSDKTFYVHGKGKGEPVPTMVGGHYFKSLDNDELTIVEMAYWSTSDDNEMVMTLLVPKQRDGLAALEAKLSPELLENWFSKLKASTMVSIHLPKWKADTSTEMSNSLSAMGLGPLFGAAADLSGISAESGLQLSAVLHKTFISVDEKGTEAAAATAIMMAGSAPAKPIELHVDHPFLYLIRDRKSGVILFIGRVQDPR